MVSIFRSEDVEFCHLIIPTDSAYDVIQALGELECVQFVNLNRDVPTTSLKFTQNIFVCEELERKLRKLKDILDSEKLSAISSTSQELLSTPQCDISALEAEITDITQEILTSNKNLGELLKGYNDLVQYRQVLRCAEIATPLESRKTSETVLSFGGLTAILGIIDKTSLIRFEQFLWRACRGNFLLRRLSEDEILKDPSSGRQVNKCIFAVYIQGNLLEAKVRKICEAFAAAVYSIPEDSEGRSQTSLALMTRIRDFEIIITQSQETRRILLLKIAKNFILYKIKVIKIKAIYSVLNMFLFETSGRSIRGKCWCPRVFISPLRDKLFEVQRAKQNEYGVILETVTTQIKPPTYFQVNQFTESFQNLVDSYAVATYKEVNPSIFMIITFPFLFSIMFGDFCHGLIIFILGLYFVIREKFLTRLENDEMFGLIFSGRYIILLMGFFSLYSGIIYNEFLSKSIYMFSSGWIVPSNITNPTLNDVISISQTKPHQTVTLDPNNFYANKTYPIGMDPIWMFAINKITFINSFKMKISIIIGFFHMIFGIFLSCVNHIYSRNILDIFSEFIPQTLFFISLFGYLVFLIFYKWIIFTAYDKSPPSILLTFINMFFNFGKEIPKSDLIYPHQEIVQQILVLVAFICIPWLLCLKPILLIIKKSQSKRSIIPSNSQTEISQIQNETSKISEQHLHDNSTVDEEWDDESKKPVGEIVIMQLIHTMEFCLGGVSNTASYLRLWALSLAHSKLSELLWGVLQQAFKINVYYGCIMQVVIMIPFLILSVSILVVMEGLSTFLHAIRLHWVEFQNKFYKGTGRPLVIFSFRSLVKEYILV